MLKTRNFDLRINICLRKSEVTAERISVCNVIEKLMEHGIHSSMLLYQLVELLMSQKYAPVATVC